MDTSSPASPKEDALAFLKSQQIGVLSTLSKEGTPRARSVYFSHDDSFNIYFVTHTDTRKWEDIQSNPHAAFVVSNEKTPQTLQIEGTLTNLNDMALINPALADLVAVLLSNTHYFAPLTRFNPATMVFVKLTPTWIRWGDFTKGHGSIKIFTEIVP